MNVTIGYEEMTEAFVCNHTYNQNIYSIYYQYRDIHHKIFTKDELIN